MNSKMALIASGLIVVLMCAIPAAQVLGAEGGIPYDPATHKIIGPTMWAVGVVNCPAAGDPFFTLRVKKIEGCAVDTDPLSGVGSVGGITACPSGEADVLYQEIGTPFNFPCEALITKVKNYNDSKGNIISFDAQIQFYVDKLSGPDECTPSQSP